MAIGEMTDEAAARKANAVLGVGLDYEVLGDRGSILMVSANGTPAMTVRNGERATWIPPRRHGQSNA